MSVTAAILIAGARILTTSISRTTTPPAIPKSYYPTTKAYYCCRWLLSSSSPNNDDRTAVDSQEDVFKVIKESSTFSNRELVVMDTRTEDEILETGFIKPSNPNHKWVNVSCQRDEAPLLEATAKYTIPNTNTPIITYCRSGVRSGRAKSILLGQGYKTVVSAGGFEDLDWLQNTLSSSST